MKVAEALLMRKELTKELSVLAGQFNSNIVIEDGVKPRRDANNIKKKFGAAATELQKLITNINHTNNVTIVNGASVMKMIARRDVLKVIIPLYGTMYSKADKVINDSRAKVQVHDGKGNYMKVDNPSQPIPELNSADMEHSYNGLASELRTLDLLLQALTWQTELIELL